MGAAIGVAGGVVVGVDLGGIVGVAGAATGVAGGTVIKVASSAASLSRVALSWSYRAIVIISLILLRARPISLSIYS